MVRSLDEGEHGDMVGNVAKSVIGDVRGRVNGDVVGTWLVT